MRRVLLLLLAFVTPLAVFAAMVMADRTFGRAGRGLDYVVKIDLTPADARLPKIEGPLDSSRPLVVIDAGHGGKDPGAGAGEPKEKELVLALALALRDELLKQGGVRVALTRSDDTYLLLGERPAIARRLGADLFISIHADSTEVESGALGASVYTLSDKGSNEAAERMAARENAADEINGIKIGNQSEDVSSILVDLSQGQTQAHSQLFAALLLREARGTIPLKESGPQSAAFAVLKSPDVPSILFETGYINNPIDFVRLLSPGGRKAFAESTARAIKVFFARTAADRAK
ncbi:MAG: N-acetylmuramoyl-L-alanine amidase [Novosphingobium sp.]|nr:N-acetylmuramoyl-L-alanine amidase [Novosphingobium sp.]MBX9645128.1 N-acetylmuramoyl-L-alanine amidase [Novosphingobium sp.]